MKREFNENIPIPLCEHFEKFANTYFLCSPFQCYDNQGNYSKRTHRHCAHRERLGAHIQEQQIHCFE